MPDFLKDTTVQFIVLAGAAIAGLVAVIVIYMLQRQRKKLTYDVISNNRVLTVREEIEGKVQVLLEGQPVRDIRLYVVRLANSGNVPIALADYDKSVSFVMGERAKIVSATVTDVEPKNLAVDVRIEDKRVVVQPVLLNPKDAVTLKILVSDFAGEPQPDGRIVGVRNIERARPGVGSAVLILLGLAAMAVGAYLVGTNMPSLSAQPGT